MAFSTSSVFGATIRNLPAAFIICEVVGNLQAFKILSAANSVKSET